MNNWIDISQIPSMHATEEHPITLHYGHHFHCSMAKSDTNHCRVSSSELTNASAIIEPPPVTNMRPQVKPRQNNQSYSQSKIQIPLIQSSYQPVPSTMSNNNAGKSKILSVRQIKEVEKRQKSVKRSSSSCKGSQYVSGKREQNLLLGGSQTHQQKQKLNLTKYLQYKSNLIKREQ